MHNWRSKIISIHISKIAIYSIYTLNPGPASLTAPEVSAMILIARQIGMGCGRIWSTAMPREPLVSRAGLGNQLDSFGGYVVFVNFKKFGLGGKNDTFQNYNRKIACDGLLVGWCLPLIWLAQASAKDVLRQANKTNKLLKKHGPWILHYSFFLI